AENGRFLTSGGEFRRETDCLLGEDGFELAVPPRRQRLWAAAPGRPEPVSGSDFRAAVSDWQRPEEPFAGAGPMVRIHLPPAESQAKSMSERVARRFSPIRCIVNRP